MTNIGLKSLQNVRDVELYLDRLVTNVDNKFNADPNQIQKKYVKYIKMYCIIDKAG